MFCCCTKLPPAGTTCMTHARLIPSPPSSINMWSARLGNVGPFGSVSSYRGIRSFILANSTNTSNREGRGITAYKYVEGTMGEWNAAKPGPMRSRSTRQSDHLAKQCGLMYVCTAFSQITSPLVPWRSTPFSFVFFVCARCVVFPLAFAARKT